MELFNHTPLAAQIDISGGNEDAPRYCQLTVKATFSFNAEGQLELDMQEPVPIFSEDIFTPLGMLPSDVLPHVQGSYSVIAHAVAHNREPQRQKQVSLTVGSESRTLTIFGNRQWTPDGQLTKPEPFIHMPITYENAFGGSCDVMLDEKSPVTVRWPYNPDGKGFDPELNLKGLKLAAQCPEGYPVLPQDYVRHLPNVENPADLIWSPGDKPLPVGWGAVSQGSPHYMVPLLETYSKEDVESPKPEDSGEGDWIKKEHLYRCHPDWLISPPPAGAEVILKGITPEEYIKFCLPELNVFMEYKLGSHTGTRCLTPFMFVLQAEIKQFYLVFQFGFEYSLDPDEERSLCLRYEKG